MNFAASKSKCARCHAELKWDDLSRRNYFCICGISQIMLVRDTDGIGKAGDIIELDLNLVDKGSNMADCSSTIRSAAGHRKD